jgi:predicted DNA-binding transcriptional regulator YafY
MRRDKSKEYYNTKCKETINLDSYNTIINAVSLNSRIYFDYLKKDGFKYRYRRVIPRGFFYAIKCYLQSFHELHGKTHTFRAWAISNVVLEGNLVLALLDPNKWSHYWDGETNILESERIG